jgi:hypothetical protein
VRPPAPASAPHGGPRPPASRLRAIAYSRYALSYSHRATIRPKLCGRAVGTTKYTKAWKRFRFGGECYGIQCPVFEVHRDQSRGLTPGPAHQLSHYPKATVARIILYPPFTHIFLFRIFLIFLLILFCVFRVFRVRTTCPYLVPPPDRGCRKTRAGNNVHHAECAPVLRRRAIAYSRFPFFAPTRRRTLGAKQSERPTIGY